MIVFNHSEIFREFNTEQKKIAFIDNKKGINLQGL